MKLLFIAWDGSGDHYMRGLFLPIMNGLQTEGLSVSVLHLSSMTEEKSEYLTQTATKQHIHYHHILIQRSPKGFVSAVRKAVKWISSYTKRNEFGVVMPRSLMPALLLRVAGLRKQRLIYDADGLALDERLDFARWTKKSLKFKFFKSVELWAMKNASSVLVRTFKAKETVLERYPILNTDQVHKVINGRANETFEPLKSLDRLARRQELGWKNEDIVAVYCGTLAPQYCLEEMLIWFKYMLQLTKNRARLLILTGQQEMVREHPMYEELKSFILLNTVSAEEVPCWLSLANIGLALRQGTFSMRGVSPIKLGEYLLCGLPVIASKGIGDTETLIDQLTYSQLIDESRRDDLLKSAEQFLEFSGQMPDLPLDESLEAGLKNYSMSQSIASYLAVLKK